MDVLSAWVQTPLLVYFFFFLLMFAFAFFSYTTFIFYLFITVKRAEKASQPTIILRSRIRFSARKRGTGTRLDMQNGDKPLMSIEKLRFTSFVKCQCGRVASYRFDLNRSTRLHSLFRPKVRRAAGCGSRCHKLTQAPF